MARQAPGWFVLGTALRDGRDVEHVGAGPRERVASVGEPWGLGGLRWHVGVRVKLFAALSQACSSGLGTVLRGLQSRVVAFDVKSRGPWSVPPPAPGRVVFARPACLVARSCCGVVLKGLWGPVLKGLWGPLLMAAQSRRSGLLVRERGLQRVGCRREGPSCLHLWVLPFPT